MAAKFSLWTKIKSERPQRRLSPPELLRLPSLEFSPHWTTAESMKKDVGLLCLSALLLYQLLALIG